jgi:hypothetical protein
MHLSLFKIAARFDYLKPTQVLDGFMRPLNGIVHGVLDGCCGSAGEFDEFIDRVFHLRFFGLFLPAQECRLFGTTGGRFLDRFTDFAGVLLNPAFQFFGFAFDVLKGVIRERGQLLFQLAFDDVAIAFDFEFIHRMYGSDVDHSVAGAVQRTNKTTMTMTIKRPTVPPPIRMMLPRTGDKNKRCMVCLSYGDKMLAETVNY